MDGTRLSEASSPQGYLGMGLRDVQDMRPFFLAPLSLVSSCASIFLEASGLSPYAKSQVKVMAGGGKRC